jgi:type I restriction-modification system DNA methylase subunit
MAVKITERTFYPVLIEIIKRHGGTGISEVKYNSEPDIIFELLDRKWILGVKLGETIPILKSAFIQYHRHKDESKIDHGILLFLPEEARSIKPSESEILKAVSEKKCTCLIDTPDIKEELRAITFPQLLVKIEQEIFPRLKRRERKEYPLSTVILLLQQHVSETMQNIKLTDKEMLRVITDKKLLSEIGNLEKNESVDIARFLASYIVLSQILFLRLFSRTRPDILPKMERKITHHWLRTAFGHVLDINYRPIFSLDVLDAVPESYIQDTFDLIWGLEIERIRYELPGRLFHELMPKAIRKMLAAFYTRPQAADILARLTVGNSSDLVFDPACGSGTILVSAYKHKLELYQEEGCAGNPHKRFCEEEIFGSDIMPFAVHLTSANLASMDPSATIETTEIIQGDSLSLSKGYRYPTGVQVTLFPAVGRGYSMKGETRDVKLEKVDVILMNPPFTKVERGIRKYVDMERFGAICGNEVGLWGHFIALADEFLKDRGTFGGVIPISILRGRESEKIRKFVFSHWTILYVLKATFNYGFSEWSEYRDVLLIAKKGKPPKGHAVKFALVKKDLRKISHEDVAYIGNQLEANDNLRTSELDIQSFPVEELLERFANLMWFCGVTDLKHRDKLVSFIDRFSHVLTPPPDDYFREGYRPVPKGVSSFMFLTRALDPCRTEEAFLFFDPADETSGVVEAKSAMQVKYEIEKTALIPSLRTGVGIKTLDISGKLDFVAQMPYKEFERVKRASGFKKPKDFDWKSFWLNVTRELSEVKTKIVTLRRINPYSPNTHLTAFFSKEPFSTSNVLNVVKEDKEQIAKPSVHSSTQSCFSHNFSYSKKRQRGDTSISDSTISMR